MWTINSYKSIRISSPANCNANHCCVVCSYSWFICTNSSQGSWESFCNVLCRWKSPNVFCTQALCSYSTYNIFSIIFCIDLRINAGLTKEALKREIKNTFRYQRLFLYVPFTYALIHYFIKRTTHSPSTTRSEKRSRTLDTLFWCRRRFDTDNSGYLDEDELMKAFLVMGMRLETEELKVIMSEYDVDGSGQIDLDEFEGMIRLG